MWADRKWLTLLVLLGVLLCSSSAFAVSDTNLIGWWKFDETSGTNMVDSKGYDHNLSLNAGTVNASGILGKGVTFTSATTQKATGTVTATLQGTTTCAWVYSTGDAEVGVVTLFGDTASGYGLTKSKSDGGGLAGYRVSGLISAVAWTPMGDQNYVKNAWNFVCMTKAGTTGILYLNGSALTSTGATSGTNGYTAFSIGAVGSLKALAGTYDEISYWNRTLSAGDITDLYNAGTGVTYCPLTSTFSASCTSTSARITWNVYRNGTTSHLADVNVDCNVNAMDVTEGDSPFASGYVDVNTSATCTFAKTGYDSNSNYPVTVDSNKTVTIYLTDSTAPSVGVTGLAGFTTYGTFIKGTGIASATVSDLGSGVASCEYTRDNGANWLAGDLNATHCYKSITISNEIYRFNFRATDVAGNTGTGTATASYTGDLIAPVTTLTSYQVPLTTDYNISLNCADGNVGCKKIWYNLNSTGWLDWNQSTRKTITDTVVYISNINVYTVVQTWDINKPETLSNRYIINITNELKTGSAGDDGNARYRIYFTDGTDEYSNVNIDITGGYVAKTYNFATTNKDFNKIELELLSESGVLNTSAKNTVITYDENLSLTPFSKLINTTGSYNLQYYGIDFLDNNESIHTTDFNITGFLTLNLLDENTLAPVNGNINFNSTDYNGVATQDINLTGLTTGTYTIAFSLPGYGTRYYITDLNQYSDQNLTMLMLDTTQGIAMNYLVFKPDQLTPYGGARVYIYKPNKLNHTIGTYFTDANGRMTVFTNLFDQNYLFDINYGTVTYQPVALTVKIPISEESTLPIDGNYRIRITGAGLQDYNNQNSDTIVYLLPNIISPYIIKIRDVDGNYFERTYYRSYRGNPLTDTLQPYLISVANGFFTTITTYDSQNYKTLPGVTIEVYKDLPGGRTLVEEIITDDKGQGLILTLLNNQYEFDTYYDSNFIKTFDITATSSTIIIYLDIGSIIAIDQNASGFGVKFTLFGNGRIKQSLGNLILTPNFFNLGRASVNVTSAVIQNGTTLATSNWVGSDFNHVFTHTIPWADINTGTLTNRITVTVFGLTYYYTQGYAITDAFDMNYSFIDGLKTGLRSDVGCSASGWCNPLLVIAVILCIFAGLMASVYMGQFSSQATGIVFVISAIIFTYLTWIPIELTLVLVLIALGFIINERRS